MRHDTAIPVQLHTRTASSVKDALGLFWSSLFKDQKLVEAEISARVLSACQAYIDAMEALSLRDHSGMPVFHREHWHPALIRLSERNTGCGLVIGMDGDPRIGEQPAGTVFVDGERFVIGGNAEYSKVYTYPLDAATGRRLVSVGTCMCDAVSAPSHILSQGRDFIVRDGVLLIRKEHDPFNVGGYNIVEDGDDRIAVLWLCDAEFDREHVGDFLAYPLGFDVKSTPAAARMLSALWDIVVYGLTPRHMNILLGALFDVPTVQHDTVVESCSDDGTTTTVVTGDAVYKVDSSLLSPDVTYGAKLSAGTFLTKELAVYHGLSKQEVDVLIDNGMLTSLELPAGSVAGVSVPVLLSNIDSTLQDRPSHADDPWFKLNADDSVDSGFWTYVFAHTDAAARRSLFASMSSDGSHINPLRSLGYLALANTVLVHTTRPIIAEQCASSVFGMLRRLMPATGSLLVVQLGPAASSLSRPVSSADALSAQSRQPDSTVAMRDAVAYQLMAACTVESSAVAATDSVAVRFIPDAVTEV